MAVSGILGGKIPVADDDLSPHEQEIYPTISLDENCIGFDFQTDRNHYVDLRKTHLVLKLKFVINRDYKTYNTREILKKNKKWAKADEEVMEEAKQEGPVHLVTHVNNILHSIFSNVECISTISEFTIQMDCMRTSPTFPTTSRGPSLKTRGFCIGRGTFMKNFLTNLRNRLCLNRFSQGERK